MRFLHVISAAAVGVLLALPARAQVVRLASWNLGWHMSAAEVPEWITKCSRSYKRDPTSKVWRVTEVGSPGSTQGWFIKESRAKLEGIDSQTVVCGVYQEASGARVAATAAAYQTRQQQLARFLEQQVKADLIAFQEVSGSQAVRDALGPAASEYEVCSFDGQFKVQRLAFAWRKSMGPPVEPCTAIAPVSLPELSSSDQVRPALTVAFKIQGKVLRFMTVHLKSSCVSPLEKGRLDNSDPASPCAVLQQQLRPLEAGVEKLASEGAEWVVFGDFNRNLWHEANEVTGGKAVRSDGTTDLTRDLPVGVLSQNLLREVFDGAPESTKGSLIPLKCSSDAATQGLCDKSKLQVLTREETGVLAGPAALGCRNPIGLDHFIVSAGLAQDVVDARKVSLGRLGRTLSPQPDRPKTLLALSDHCPIVMDLRVQ